MSQGLQRGVLVTFEGIDGGGKSTQAGLLAEWGNGQGLEVVLTKEPTHGHWGQKIRDSKFTARLSPVEELNCFIEDRREHVAELIRPALERGALVVIDRYYHSNAAYQGALGLDPLDIIARNEAFAPRPDVVVLLDVVPSVGLERVQKRGEGQDLFETIEALTRVRAIFAELPGPFVRIDAKQPRPTVHQKIIEAVAPLVKARR